MPLDGNPADYTVETEPSLEGLLRWLEGQDPQTEYDFCDIHDCLLCRYVRACGHTVHNLGPYTWTDDDGRDHRLPYGLNAVSNAWSPRFTIHDRTYGAAAARCRSLLAERSR